MNGLRFVLVALGFLFWVALHLCAAVWALRKLGTNRAGEIDLDYTRVENYHAREIREGRLNPGFEYAPFSRDSRGPAFRVLVSRGDCLVPSGTSVGAVVCWGPLTLQDGVAVTMYADSGGEMILGKDATIGGRATSSTAIRLERSSRVRSLAAPEITTARNRSAAILHLPEAPPVTIPMSDGVDAGRHGLSPARLVQIGSDTWTYKGDLWLDAPLILRAKLIVFGSVRLAPHSILEEDLKATAEIRIGAASICRGKLISDRNIELGPGARFERVIYCAGELRLGNGVRGEGPESVVAYAAGRLLLEDDVLVRGKLASGREVVCLP